MSVPNKFQSNETNFNCIRHLIGKSNFMIRKLITILLLFPFTFSISQDYDVPFGHIVLDSVVITAVKQGLDINDLIEIMQYDSTLYIAFNNLHFTGCQFEHELKAHSKKNELVADKFDKIVQSYNDKCREQEVLVQRSNGDFKDIKGKNLYYTKQLFERTFYTNRKVCGEKRKTNWKDVVYGAKTDGHIAAIKRVIFNPGTPVDLPLIGNKFALFDPSMTKYYNYSIERKVVNGYDCFVFSILVKPEYQNSRKDVVVRKLVTAFQRSDFQIIERDYHLYYKGAIVKMDINMDVSMTKSKGLFYPSVIDYKGFWKVPTKKAERIKFETKFEY